MPNKINIFLIVASCLILFSTACRKDDDQIPNVPVDIYINITDPNFVPLNSVNGNVFITGGVKGIVVYRKSVTEFMAYDRCCSHKPSESCERVELDTSTTLFLLDKCCGSKFLITDGSVQNPPAIRPLKSYNTAFDGTTIHIYN